MRINDEYKIEMVLVEINKDGSYEKTYDNFEEYKNNSLYNSFNYCFRVVDRFNRIPDGCYPYHDSPEEAMMDYICNVK